MFSFPLFYFHKWILHWRTRFFNADFSKSIRYLVIHGFFLCFQSFPVFKFALIQIFFSSVSFFMIQNSKHLIQFFFRFKSYCFAWILSSVFFSIFIFFSNVLICINVNFTLKQVIAGVMDQLNLKIPPFVRIDLFQIILMQALSNGKQC